MNPIEATLLNNRRLFLKSAGLSLGAISAATLGGVGNARPTLPPTLPPLGRSRRPPNESSIYSSQGHLRSSSPSITSPA